MGDQAYFSQEILRKSKQIRKAILETNPPKISKKILILSGSTIGEISGVLELFCLNHGIAVEIVEGEYGRFFEQAVFEAEKLAAYDFDFVYVHTSNRNIRNWPEPFQSEEQISDMLKNDFGRFERVLTSLQDNFRCPIIQNNFEPKPLRVMGNMDVTAPSGHIHYINALNELLYRYATAHPGVYIQDISFLASMYGLGKWQDASYWHRYKYALTLNAIPYLCHNLSNIIKSICGLNKKCIALDLDDTLWSGVIGDDGEDGIEIGPETPLGEAHMAFQAYLRQLKAIGIMLAVVSKNDESIARKAFSRPEMLLSAQDFTEFIANWEPKSANLYELARKMNLGADAFVFVDDNPAEREEVRRKLPDIAAPIMDDVDRFAQSLDEQGYFETTGLSEEDGKRNEYYSQNKIRDEEQSRFSDYQEYLKSLDMHWEFEPFRPDSIGRIVQLINKTNQFNLTTLRVTLPEVEEFMRNDAMLCIQGRLTDKFGDNGIVTLFIGEIVGKTLHIRLWLMSCRVFKRELEFRLWEYIQNICLDLGISLIIGEYRPTEKNVLVKDFFSSLGFTRKSITTDDVSTWEFPVTT